MTILQVKLEQSLLVNKVMNIRFVQILYKKGKLAFDRQTTHDRHLGNDPLESYINPWQKKVLIKEIRTTLDGKNINKGAPL